MENTGTFAIAAATLSLAFSCSALAGDPPYGELLSLVVRVEKIGDGPAWRRSMRELAAIPGS